MYLLFISSAFENKICDAKAVHPDLKADIYKDKGCSIMGAKVRYGIRTQCQIRNSPDCFSKKVTIEELIIEFASTDRYVFCRCLCDIHSHCRWLGNSASFRSERPEAVSSLWRSSLLSPECAAPFKHQGSRDTKLGPVARAPYQQRKYLFEIITLLV